MNSISKVREGYLDWLRIVAAMMVVAIHTLGYSIMNQNDSSIAGIISYFVRSAVPVFFMVSGAVWLSPGFDFTFRRLARAFVRLLLIYFVWNFVYALVFDYGSYSVIALLKHTWKGHFHMWFFEYLLGVYLLIPILRPVVSYKDGSLLPYVVALFAIFGILCPTANAVTLCNEEIRLITGKIHYELIGFSGYFLTGYWLSSLNCIIGRGSLCAIFLLSVGLHTMVGNYGVLLPADSDSFWVFVFAEACSLFLLMKNVAGCTPPSPAVLKLSGATFGVYIIHPFFVEKVSWEWLRGFPESVACLFMLCLILGASFSISVILKKIPFVNRWLV